MAYCRFSSNGYQSDVYVYDHIHGGIIIQVADARYARKDGKQRPTQPVFSENKSYLREILDYHNKISEWLKECKLVPIGLKHDGEEFRCANCNDCLNKLLYLKSLGYLIPQSVIDELSETIFG